MNKLLLIDPHFSLRSPTLKSMLREFPACFDDFDEVEVWAVQSDFEHHKLKNDIIHCPFKSWLMVSLYFWVAVHFRYFWRYIILRSVRPKVIQATNYYCYGADLIFCQFSFLAYKKIIQQHREIFRMSFIRRVIFAIHYAQEWILFKILPAKRWWMVSRCLMEECRGEAPEGSKFSLLPNGYDERRFNHENRAYYRNLMRRQLGFGDKEIIFIFVSLGDLERKGFGLAVQTVHQLVLKGYSARLLFVGGPTESPMNLDSYLAGYGISNFDFLSIQGRVNDVERYMSAADALLFPSYCEAFALVEIESGALGLRLYLTPHFGSEMIIREPNNGRFIPWDVEESVKIIASDIDNGCVTHSNGDMGEALNRGEYLKAVRHRYRDVLQSL